ncbi:hypothetical protein INR49_009617, partial [Caranx melampygus]
MKEEQRSLRMSFSLIQFFQGPPEEEDLYSCHLLVATEGQPSPEPSFCSSDQQQTLAWWRGTRAAFIEETQQCGLRDTARVKQLSGLQAADK